MPSTPWVLPLIDKYIPTGVEDGNKMKIVTAWSFNAFPQLQWNTCKFPWSDSMPTLSQALCKAQRTSKMMIGKASSSEKGLTRTVSLITLLSILNRLTEQMALNTKEVLARWVAMYDHNLFRGNRHRAEKECWWKAFMVKSIIIWSHSKTLDDLSKKGQAAWISV